MMYITGDTHGRFERVEAFCRRFQAYTLVALTIMIAESRPEKKEMMVSVVMNCIK